MEDSKQQQEDVVMDTEQTLPTKEKFVKDEAKAEELKN